VEHEADHLFRDRLSEVLQGKGPVYALGDAGVELVHSDARTLDEVIAEACDLACSASS